MNIIANTTDYKAAKDIEIPEIFYRRITTGIAKFDKFLSGGWLPGSTFTFTGRAGLGKSTLMLQTMESAAKLGYSVGVAGSEESIYQMAFTCKRLGVGDVLIANKSDIDEIVDSMSTFDILLVDSFQSLTTKHDLTTRAHEKYCYETIINKAKEHECVTGFICHLTKTGMLKGSSDILHAVDANLRVDGPESEEDLNVRHISFDKNRFGLAGELTVLMTDKGYDFSVDIEQSPEDNTPKTTNNRQQLWADVLKLEGDITIQKVMPIVGGNVASAMTLLREMVLNEMLVKEGRGNRATYDRLK
jgi:predicted ATP-dependent serine protease